MISGHPTMLSKKGDDSPNTADISMHMDFFKRSVRYQFNVRMQQSHMNLFNFINDITPEYLMR